MKCKTPGCGSYAINHHHHGRDGTDEDLCDVCYWRKRAERKPLTEDEAEKVLASARTPGMRISALDACKAIEKAHGIF